MPLSTNSGPLRQIPSRQTKDVLLIEPPSAARDRHTKTLTRHKYKVTTAENIDDARNLWAPGRYGLVVVSLDGFAEAAGLLCDDIRNSDHGQVIALIFNPDQELPATDCPTLIFTTEPDEYFLARVETLTAVAYAA